MLTAIIMPEITPLHGKMLFDNKMAAHDNFNAAPSASLIIKGQCDAHPERCMKLHAI